MINEHVKHIAVLALLAVIAYPVPQSTQVFAESSTSTPCRAGQVCDSIKTANASAKVTGSNIVLTYDNRRKDSLLTAILQF